MTRPGDLAARLGIGRRVGLGWPLLLGALAATAGVALLAISGWFLTGAAIAGMTGSVAAFNYLLPSAAIRGLAILRTASRYGERLTGHGAALGAMAGLRARLFGRLSTADSRTAPDLSGGDASARLIGDIEALEELVVRRSIVPAALVGGVVAAMFIALAGWPAVLAFILMTALGLLLWPPLARHMTRRAAQDAITTQGALREHFVELAAARPEIVAYGLADHVVARLARLISPRDAARLALARAEARIAALLILWNVATAVVVLLMARGDAAIVALAGLAALAGAEASAAAVRAALRDASVRAGLDRLGAIADLPDSVLTAARPLATSVTIDGHTVRRGARVALIGASGSGKTSRLEALAGLRPARSPLHVDGQPIGTCTAADLVASFALAPQSPMLIAGTIADNLRIARPGLSDGDMWIALDTACLGERIRTMPGGLDTPLGEGGGTLSGGEQKRLALARALLAERPWLLADEPSEGLDAATEAQLIANLRVWLDRHSAGLILVSHRTAPRALCDAEIHLPL